MPLETFDLSGPTSHAARPPRDSRRSRSCSPAAARSSPTPTHDGAPRRRSGVALVFGLVIMAMVYATGHLSGAHINPAVTVAFTLTRHFPRRDAVAYIAAQLAGAVAAALGAAGRLDRQARASSARPCPRSAPAPRSLYEAVLTAFLMFVIIAVATDTRAVGAAAAHGDRGDGRPRRTLRRPDHRRLDEPGALVRSGAGVRRVDDFWIYIVGPLLGAALGALAYQLVRAPGTPPGGDAG